MIRKDEPKQLDLYSTTIETKPCIVLLPNKTIVSSRENLQGTCYRRVFLKFLSVLE